MSALPPALARWARALSDPPLELGVDLAGALAPWGARLAVAVGPLAISRALPSGEPDGYGGLGRRGTYERLLVGEWAIAEAYPDEFIRRASAREHLFLELARRTPAADRRTVALVAAGPSQLGAPRLLHLVALVVLARRAAEAGIGFAWGVLEQVRSGSALAQGFDRASLTRLLHARTVADATTEVAACIRAAATGEMAGPAGAAPRSRDLEEIWVIGAAAQVAAARRAGATGLSVGDLLQPGARRLALELARPGRRTVALQLELPAPEICAALLRDPVAPTAVRPPGPAPRPVAAIQGAPPEVRFSAEGGTLQLVTPLQVTSWSLRAGRAAGRATWLQGTGRRQLVATGARRHGVIAAWLHGNEHELQIALPASPDGWNWVKLPPPAQPPERWEGVGHAAVVIAGGQLELAIALPWGAVIRIDGAMSDPRNHPKWRCVHLGSGRGVIRTTSGLLIIEEPADGTVRLRRLVGDSSESYEVMQRTGPPARGPSFVTGFPDGSRPMEVLLAIAAGGGAWELRTATRRIGRIIVAAEQEVLGCGMHGGKPYLLIREEERRLILEGSGGDRIPLPTLGAGIASARTHPAQPQIAWLTHSGRLQLHALGDPTLRLDVDASRYLLDGGSP